MISLKDDPEAFPVRQLTILGELPPATSQQTAADGEY